MRNAIGYILGFLIFVAGIPALMWWVSGRPFPWWPLIVFAAEVILLTLQVGSEEKRLEEDFGDEYRTYKQNTPRYIIKFKR